MAAVVPSASSYYETEKTEPYNTSEYLKELAEKQKPPPNSPNALGTTMTNFHLDEAVVPADKDIRLLVRPLTSRQVSPGRSDSYEWLTLRSERSDAAAAANDSDSDGPDYITAPVETVLAVTQTSKDISFTVRMPGETDSEGTAIPPLFCELYYESASDNQILKNTCDFPISLSRVYPTYSPQMSSSLSVSSLSPPSSSDGTPVTPGTPAQDDTEHIVYPGMTRALLPGTWRIKMEDIAVLDFRILERRRPVYRALPAPPAKDSQNTSSLGKRSFSLVAEGDDDDSELPEAQRQKVDDDSDTPASPNSKGPAVQFIRPTAEPFVFPLPNSDKEKELGTIDTSRQHSHALLDLKTADSVVIPGSHDADEYALTKQGDVIASTRLSTVFTGRIHGHPEVPAGSIVIVKVIKTESSSHDQGNWNVTQAKTWKREVDQHGALEHNSIVRLYAADARCLSLYMEYIDAHDLSRVGEWRQPNTEHFLGDRADATRILRDISGALNYVHGLKVVHSDIKPANILFSRARGAVLCDFGLSTPTAKQETTGGTPYYLPPEFIGLKQRGPPSDVWALGIVMLYVLRKIALPDTRGARQRPNPLYWKIADVNGPMSNAVMPPHSAQSSIPTRSLPAAVQMRMWLSEVNEAKMKLNRDNKIERLTYEMLTPNRKQRITMQQVVDELLAED